LSLVLADTSVWVAHFRSADRVLQLLLENDQVLCHPLIVLELACGTPPAPRAQTLSELRALRRSVVATTDEAMALIERHRLHGSGCGAVDLALLASARLTPGATLWTLDARLVELARTLDLAFDAAEV
jgi:predicted nucleic acid-binding protein